MITNNEITKLNPVLALHGYAQEFPHKAGKYVCEFEVYEGSIEIRQKSFDLFSGLWDLDGADGKERTYLMRAGDRKEITFTSEIHDWEPDTITVANHSYLKPARFSCKIKTENIS